MFNDKLFNGAGVKCFDDTFFDNVAFDVKQIFYSGFVFWDNVELGRHCAGLITVGRWLCREG